MSSLRELCINVLFAGIRDTESAVVRKTILVTTIFSLVSMMLLTAFGLENLLHGREKLGFILLLTALIVLFNYLYLRYSRNYRRASLLIIILASFLFFYLLITGATENTGFLWFYILPTLAFYVLGLKRGTVFMATVFVLIGYLLFVPDNPIMMTSYSVDLSLRFLGSLLAVAITVFLYEYTRRDDHQEMLEITRRLDYLSQTDDLTGLANRRGMTDYIKREIARYERKGRPFCLLVADLDYFKQVNDRYGHECGDLVLQSVAATLEQNMKKQDIVSRWGGEEFIMLLPETTGEQARLTAERQRRAIEELAISYNHKTIKVTISIGVTEYLPGSSFDEIIKSADSLLYKAKRSGRNQIV